MGNNPPKIESKLVEIFVVKYDNDVGQSITEKYVYDFRAMSLSRIFYAEQLFLLDYEFYKKEHIPGSDDQFRKAMQRSAFKKALAAILMKVVGKGYEKFNSETEPDTTIFDYLTGECYEKLLRVKNDFFSQSVVMQTTLVQESLMSIEKLSRDLTKEQFTQLVEAAKALNTRG